MPRRKEPWESSAAGPFLTIDSPTGAVTVWSLGEERFRVSAGDHEEEVVGLEQARARAHELAGVVPDPELPDPEGLELLWDSFQVGG